MLNYSVELIDFVVFLLLEGFEFFSFDFPGRLHLLNDFFIVLHLSLVEGRRHRRFLTPRGHRSLRLILRPNSFQQQLILLAQRLFLFDNLLGVVHGLLQGFLCLLVLLFKTLMLMIQFFHFGADFIELLPELVVLFHELLNLLAVRVALLVH